MPLRLENPAPAMGDSAMGDRSRLRGIGSLGISKSRYASERGLGIEGRGSGVEDRGSRIEDRRSRIGDRNWKLVARNCYCFRSLDAQGGRRIMGYRRFRRPQYPILPHFRPSCSSANDRYGHSESNGLIGIEFGEFRQKLKNWEKCINSSFWRSLGAIWIDSVSVEAFRSVFNLLS